MTNKKDLYMAVQRIEAVIESLINNPPANVNINDLMRDYNMIRSELNKILLEK